MAATLAGVDFRNSALVQPKVRRNVMLVVPLAEPIPDLADSFVVERCAKAPVIVCHV